MSHSMKFRSRVFFAADLLAGHMTGKACPSCRSRGAARVIRKHGGFASIYRCDSCGLLFRPTGLQSGRVARWYYSHFYGDDQEFTTGPLATRDGALAAARNRGKDRTALVQPVLDALPPEHRAIGVLGASWGYELLTFEALGVPVWGIEPGDSRREHGRRSFGLELYASLDEARRAGRGGGLIVSSHVLEHIPALASALTELTDALKPVAQLHITPRVDPVSPAIAPVIGREHPLGVTEEFWTRWAAGRGAALRLHHHQPGPTDPACELVAVLSSDEALDLGSLPLPRAS